MGALDNFTDNCGSAGQCLSKAEEMIIELSQLSNQNTPSDAIATQCKAQLHECVTCLESAEIYLAEVEQKQVSPSQLQDQRQQVKGQITPSCLKFYLFYICL